MGDNVGAVAPTGATSGVTTEGPEDSRALGVEEEVEGLEGVGVGVEQDAAATGEVSTG